jgi:hypothetical protein
LPAGVEEERRKGFSLAWLLRALVPTSSGMRSTQPLLAALSPPSLGSPPGRNALTEGGDPVKFRPRKRPSLPSEEDEYKVEGSLGSTRINAKGRGSYGAFEGSEFVVEEEEEEGREEVGASEARPEESSLVVAATVVVVGGAIAEVNSAEALGEDEVSSSEPSGRGEAIAAEGGRSSFGNRPAERDAVSRP